MNFKEEKIMTIASAKSIALCAESIEKVVFTLSTLITRVDLNLFSIEEYTTLYNQLIEQIKGLELLTAKITEIPIRLQQDEIDLEIKMLDLLVNELELTMSATSFTEVSKKDKEYEDAKYFAVLKKACFNKLYQPDQKPCENPAYKYSAGKWGNPEKHGKVIEKAPLKDIPIKYFYFRI